MSKTPQVTLKLVVILKSCCERFLNVEETCVEAQETQETCVETQETEETAGYCRGGMGAKLRMAVVCSSNMNRWILGGGSAGGSGNGGKNCSSRVREDFKIKHVS